MGINERWEKGIPHDPRSVKLVKAMADIDFANGDGMCIKTGGDGDNGEHMMYLLDIYFANSGAVEAPPMSNGAVGMTLTEADKRIRDLETTLNHWQIIQHQIRTIEQLEAAVRALMLVVVYDPVEEVTEHDRKTDAAWILGEALIGSPVDGETAK